jgi:diadenosine tetraphosphatase ApaH/serine/threonine PP2A family protein phosphatase
VRYLIVTDIHSNLEALEAVLESAKGDYDRVLCCGDLVGYGADPQAVIEWARANVAVIVRGNHDKVAAGSEDIEWFSPAAKAAALWTREAITPAQLDYLRTLPRGPLDIDDFQIMHGAPLDEDEYLISSYEVSRQLQGLEREVNFFGHTHVQGGFRCHRNGNRQIGAPTPWESEFMLTLQPDELFLINPGSVGQPRDGDWRASYCIYIPEDRAVVFRRVRYDVDSAQEKIRAAGLPDLLADRLSAGR